MSPIPQPVSFSEDAVFTHATFPEGRSVKSNPTLHNTSSLGMPLSVCVLGVPKIFPKDKAGIIPTDRISGISAKIISFIN